MKSNFYLVIILVVVAIGILACVLTKNVGTTETIGDTENMLSNTTTNTNSNTENNTNSVDNTVEENTNIIKFTNQTMI